MEQSEVGRKKAEKIQKRGVYSVLFLLFCGFMLMTLLGLVEAQNDLSIKIETIVSGLTQPLYVTHAGDGSGRLFIVEQPGRIQIYQNGELLPQPFLAIESLISTGGERGLLGLAFHPNYRANRRFFINYTRAGDGATVIAEYRALDTNPNVALPEARILLIIPQPFANHNGGMIEFGPDGFLYIGMGDGGSGGDPFGAGQNIENLLGKMLRIDVDNGDPYKVPTDNPFFGPTPGRDEIYAVGFRNPFRFSFDRQTGALYAGDVGQNRLEEVDIVVKGGNYGWSIMEGSSCFNPVLNCDRRGLVLPIAEYGRDVGCSITGGYVYRGKLSPALEGTYLYGDFCTGIILGYRNGKVTELLRSRLNISSFGEDEAGELYVVGYSGTVNRIMGPNEPCSLICPADITVVDSDGDGAERVTFNSPQMTGNCGVASFTIASGSTFPIGTTTVTATSAIGNGRCSFNVTVKPKPICTLSCPPDITVEDVDGNGSEIVNFSLPDATVDCSAIAYSISSGSAFPVGTTTVTATSAIGEGRCSFTVTVKPRSDTMPPFVQITSPNGGEKVRAGSTLTINWQSSDNVGIAAHDVLLSTDGGTTFPIILAAGLPGTSRTFAFALPAGQAKSKTARIRVIATDSAGNKGQDDSDSNFRIKKR
jgi:glucose/arabinose dehydrogenase